MITYKEQKQRLTDEFGEKLRKLKEDFIKYAHYSKGQIVLYRVPDCTSIDCAYNNTYVLHIGVISHVYIDDSDFICYRVGSACISDDQIVREGRTQHSVREHDILEVLNSEGASFKFFNDLI